MNRRRFLRNAAGIFVPAVFVRRALGQGLLVGQDVTFAGNMRLGTSGGAPPSYLISEDFEGTGTPTNWTDEGGATGTLDFHNTSSPIEGSKDLKLTAPNKATYGQWAVAQDEVFMVCMVKWTTLPSATTNWIGIDTAGAAAFLTSIQTNNNGNILCRHNDTQWDTLVGNINTNVWYVKMRYKKGTGANGISTVELSSDGVFIGSGNYYSTITNGAGTAQARCVELINFNGTSICQYDHVRASTTDYGNFSNWI